MSEIGHRVIVRGPTCSGKSTLAETIARRLGVPHIELDIIHWKPGWEKPETEDFLAGVAAALEKSPDGWVVDGNYSETQDLTLPLADTVIWLHFPFGVVFRRLLRRTVARCIDHKPVCGDNYESWRQSFFSRDSLILYQVTNWRRYQQIGEDLEKYPHHAKLIELRSEREVNEFLDSIS
jgi:adenylate kinase family enzyme